MLHSTGHLPDGKLQKGVVALTALQLEERPTSELGPLAG